jgi:AAHS family 4-hydroxybenzoate transporter-like MFS transporter
LKAAATSHAIDVEALLDRASWSVAQKAAVFLSAIAVIFDGFDNQLLGFAIPSLVADWHLPRSSFGPIFAIGLIGMSIGSGFAGYIGDRLGRKTALISSALLFGAATLGTAFCYSLPALGILRFFAGAGIGGALPNAGALSAEFTPARLRAWAVSITIVCVPAGGALAGLTAGKVLPVAGWRMLFIIGGVSGILLAALLAAILPESPRFLARHPNQWSKLRELLQRFGHSLAPGTTFTAPAPTARTSFGELTSSTSLRNTLNLWLAFFFCLLSVYSVFNWLPALLTARGLPLSLASAGLTAYNFGGMLGPIALGLTIHWLGSRIPFLTYAFCGVATAVLLALMPLSAMGDHTRMLWTLAAHGFFVNAVQTALFALAAHIYPTRVRATGVAAAVGIGRIGAVLSAFSGGAAIQAGHSVFFGLLAASLCIVFVGLALIRNHIPRSSQLIS